MESLIDLLFRKAEWYVTGNHDREMLERREYRGVPIVDKLILGDTLFIHGDLFDIVNQDGHVLGNIVTRIVGWIERHVWKDIDLYAVEALEKWVRKQGRFGSPEIYRQKGLRFIRAMSVGGKPIRRIVMGHSHRKDEATVNGLAYLNTGAWVNGKQDLTTIEI